MDWLGSFSRASFYHVLPCFLGGEQNEVNKLVLYTCVSIGEWFYVVCLNAFFADLFGKLCVPLFSDT